MKVVRVAKNLRGKDEWEHVFIGADEAKKEHEKPWKLRQELRKRRGEKLFFMRT